MRLAASGFLNVTVAVGAVTISKPDGDCQQLADDAARTGVTTSRGMQGRLIMMGGMSGSMMWGMGLVWLLAVIVLLLAIAALIKYVFFK
jgi:hypothetical protein